MLDAYNAFTEFKKKCERFDWLWWQSPCSDRREKGRACQERLKAEAQEGGDDFMLAMSQAWDRANSGCKMSTLLKSGNYPPFMRLACLSTSLEIAAYAAERCLDARSDPHRH